jgi:hypothetical protein
MGGLDQVDNNVYLVPEVETLDDHFIHGALAFSRRPTSTSSTELAKSKMAQVTWAKVRVQWWEIKSPLDVPSESIERDWCVTRHIAIQGRPASETRKQLKLWIRWRQVVIITTGCILGI